MIEFFTITEPKARKQYLCDLCGGEITRGQKYTRYSMKYDGDMFDYKYHLSCKAIIDEYCTRNEEYEYDDDSISEWLYEEVCCNLCDIETRDYCFHSAMRCPKVLEYFENQTDSQRRFIYDERP